jgi:hypothetical protein
MAWHNFGIFVLKQIDTDGSKGIDTPLRVSIATKVFSKERPKVIGESSIDNCGPRSAHDLSLKRYIMLCES